MTLSSLGTRPGTNVMSASAPIIAAKNGITRARHLAPALRDHDHQEQQPYGVSPSPVAADSHPLPAPSDHNGLGAESKGGHHVTTASHSTDSNAGS